MKDGTMRALVIGCGQIGAFFDAPGQDRILTHAHAYRADRRISEVGFLDQDPAAARKAAAVWGGTALPDLESALSRWKPDVVSVCVPDDAHYAVLARLLETDVRLILSEKPLTLSPVHADEVVRLAGQRGIVVNVNYSRRFDPIVGEIRSALRRGEYGAVQNAVATYAKGILHNGSHVIDLARFLLGEVEEAAVLASRAGHGGTDPTLDCWLRMRDCPSVHLLGLDERNYSIHELDLYCERGRIRFTRFGFHVEEQTVVLDPVFPGYRELSEPRIRPTGLGGSMARYLDDGLKAVFEGVEPACPASDAAVTLKVCLGLLAKHQKEDGLG
jgi:predicted dehydrogenase